MVKKAAKIIAWLILPTLAGGVIGVFVLGRPVLGLLLGTVAGAVIGFYQAACVVDDSKPEEPVE